MNQLINHTLSQRKLGNHEDIAWILGCQTPAIVYSESAIIKSLHIAQKNVIDASCHLLYSLKSCSNCEVLKLIARKSQGFSVSSLFEAILANDILGEGKPIHFTSPGLIPQELNEISELCSHISFNSLSQLERFHYKIGDNCQTGIRINTELSFVKDDRYNPCRKHSKLGVPLSQVCEIFDNNSKLLKDVEGVMFHTNCESELFKHLHETVVYLDRKIPRLLDQVSWINMGGGYLFDESTNWKPFMKAVTLLEGKYGLDVYFEPGKSIVERAGYIVSTVLDIVERDGKEIAILDTTVNHAPEVFEYQYKPIVMQESSNGPCKYILAGASCLSGDLFGEYTFDDPLAVGSRIVFENMGAYTLVKAHMFNGINLPTVYFLRNTGSLEQIREFDYMDFLSKYGANNYELIRKVNKDS